VGEDIVTTSAERLALYKRRMKNAGFRRISIWISAELAEKLAQERGSGECGGRTLERLLLGKSAKRPDFPYGSLNDGEPHTS
jgi:hypothetical protein